MILRKRDRIEMFLWAVLALGSAVGVALAENRLGTTIATLEKCPYVQAER